MNNNKRKYTALEKILALIFAHALILALMYMWAMGFDIRQIAFLAMSVLSLDYYIIGYKGNQENLEYERARGDWLMTKWIEMVGGIKREVVIQQASHYNDILRENLEGLEKL